MCQWIKVVFLVAQGDIRQVVLMYWCVRNTLYFYCKCMYFCTLLGDDQDYTTWLAHSTDPGAPSDGCVLGYKEQYRRLKKSSVCQNGRDYLVSRESVNCDCTLDDYMW